MSRLTNGDLPTFFVVALLMMFMFIPEAIGQSEGESTRNLTLIRSVSMSTSIVEVDQHDDRPVAYFAETGKAGFSIVSLVDGNIVATWRPQTGGAATQDLALARVGDQYIVVVLSATALDIVDVTNERTPSLIRKLDVSGSGTDARAFGYRHSGGPAVIGIASGDEINLFDGARLVAGDTTSVTIRTPEQLERGSSGFDYVYMEYHLPSGQDRLYGGGAGGYHIFDITSTNEPVHLASVNPATIPRGQVVAPTPDGRYIVTTAGYEWSPVRVFDLQPLFSGESALVRTSESAWSPNWKGLTRSIEIRWPLVFAASSGDGLQVFNLRDASAPYTIAYFGATASGKAGEGAFDVDVRNVDGHIVLASTTSGLSILRLDELQAWNGNGFGQPNTSSAQNWEAGPDMVGPE